MDKGIKKNTNKRPFDILKKVFVFESLSGIHFSLYSLFIIIIIKKMYPTKLIVLSYNILWDLNQSSPFHPTNYRYILFIRTKFNLKFQSIVFLYFKFLK